MDDIPRAEVVVSTAPDTLPAPIRHAVAAEVLASEQVVVSAPLSFAGSASRIWKLTALSTSTWPRVGLTVAAVLLIASAWTFVAAWYLVWGVFLIPYRLIRRGQRKSKRQALQHRETLSALQANRE